MIHITFARHWFTVVAVTVNDNRDVHVSFGWTERGAQKKLIKSMEEFYE